MLLRLIALGLLLISTQAFPNELYYTITPAHQTQNGHLNIELKFKVGNNGVEKIDLPDSWTDAYHLYENIKNLKVISNNAKLLNTNKPSEKIIVSKKNEWVRLSYQIVNDSLHPFKPHIDSTGFSFIAHAALISPVLESDKTHKYVLYWNINKDKNPTYIIANTFETNNLVQTIYQTHDGFKKAVFTGGNLKIDKINLESGALFVVNNVTNEYTHRSTEQISKLIDFQRKKMGEKNIPYYLVAMLKSEKNYPNSFAATNIGNSSIFFYDDSWFKQSEAERVRLLSHELFHYWTGQKIQGSYDYLNTMWFFEGFTEYFGIKFAHESGFLTLEEKIALENKYWKGHYLSDFRRVTNREQALYYWDNKELHSQPYIKGYFFAQHLENHIKNNKTQVENLQALLQNLIETKKQKPSSQFTETFLLQAISKMLNYNVGKDYIRYFVRGECFEPIFDLYPNKYTLTWEKIPVADYGFNVTHTFLENKAIGVIKGKAAHQAGLEEGYLIKSMQIDQKNSHHPEIEITFYSPEGSLQTKKLYAQFVSKKIPVYRPADIKGSPPASGKLSPLKDKFAFLFILE